MGMITDKLRAHLAQVAESDARALRATDEALADVRALIAGQTPLLAADRNVEIEAAVELLRSAGYTVTPPAAD